MSSCATSHSYPSCSSLSALGNRWEPDVPFFLVRGDPQPPWSRAAAHRLSDASPPSHPCFLSSSTFNEGLRQRIAANFSTISIDYFSLFLTPDSWFQVVEHKCWVDSMGLWKARRLSNNRSHDPHQPFPPSLNKRMAKKASE